LFIFDLHCAGFILTFKPVGKAIKSLPCRAFSAWAKKNGPNRDNSAIEVLPILHNFLVKIQSDKSRVFFVFLGRKIHNNKVLEK
jgi:hypothetical protein